MITEKSIMIPIYDFKVYICIFDKLEEVRKEYPRYFNDGCKACTLEWEGCSKAKLIIPSNNLSDVVHELEHLKNLVWKAKGYSPTNNNDEPDAYLMGWLFSKVEKFIKEHQRLSEIKKINIRINQQ